MLTFSLVRATCPAMPTPNGIGGILDSPSSSTAASRASCSTDSGVTSKSLATKYLDPLGPLAKNRLPLSLFVRMLTFTRILWHSVSTSNSFAMSRISSISKSGSFRLFRCCCNSLRLLSKWDFKFNFVLDIKTLCTAHNDSTWNSMLQLQE